MRLAAKSSQGQVISHQPAFNLASDRFDGNAALKQAKAQGATVVVLIPDAGVGLYNAIPNALRVIKENNEQFWLIGGDSLYSADLLKSDQILSSTGIERTTLAIAWHPLNDINSQFLQQAQTLWKIDQKSLSSNTDITWRTATSYDAVLVLSAALKRKPSRSGIQQTLSMAEFAVTGVTGIIRFTQSDRRDSKITMVQVSRKCNSSSFVFTLSDRPLKCS